MPKKNNEQVEIIRGELKKFSKIEALYLSEGGEILFKSLMADAVSCIDTLIAKYPTLTQQEFIALSAEVKSKIDLARVLKKSVKNTKQARLDLEEALLGEDE